MKKLLFCFMTITALCCYHNGYAQDVDYDYSEEIDSTDWIIDSAVIIQLNELTTEDIPCWRGYSSVSLPSRQTRYVLNN